MTSCFFYKLNLETSEFESVFFPKDEILLSEFKKLIIKDKFENSIGLKELGVIDYNSRKKYSDKDILKKNSYFIVSKIPKLTLSTKNASSQNKPASHQVATIQPFIASEAPQTCVETLRTDVTPYSYEHPSCIISPPHSSITHPTILYTNHHDNTYYPTHQNYSEPQQQMLINPHNPPYPAYLGPPPTYFYSASEAFVQPPPYQPYLYPSPLAIYPPYYPHPSTQIYPATQYNVEGRFTSPMDGGPRGKVYKSQGLRSPQRSRHDHYSLSHHDHKKAQDRSSRHDKHSSQYGKDGGRRDWRRSGDSRRRRSHSRDHKRPHKDERYSRERRYSKGRRYCKSIDYSNDRRYLKERKYERSKRSVSRHRRTSRETKIRISRETKGELRGRCGRSRDEGNRRREYDAHRHSDKHSFNNDDDDDVTSRILKSVVSRNDGGVNEHDKEMAWKKENMKDDRKSSSLGKDSESEKSFKRSRNDGDARKSSDDENSYSGKDNDDPLLKLKKIITKSCSDTTLFNNYRATDDSVTNNYRARDGSVASEVNNENTLKEESDRSVKSDTEIMAKSLKVSLSKFKKIITYSPNKQHTKTERKEDSTENENVTSSSHQKNNTNLFSNVTRKIQIKTVSNQLSPSSYS